MSASPFADARPSADPDDALLCRRAVGGDAEALKQLVRRHQPWVYNLAVRLVLSPADAEDLAQEAMIRIITRLDQFRGEAGFRTWAYRIVVNRFRDSRRRKLERSITTFAAYGQELDDLPSTPLDLPDELQPERALIVEDAKVGCMLGMLLCLDREQRLVYVLGEIFGAPSRVAADILEIEPAAFRKRLQRARRDMTAFMNDKCGLLRESNPCRCDRKTTAFIRRGWVDPRRLKFTTRHVSRLHDAARARVERADAVEERYAELFREHPLMPGPDLSARLHELLEDPDLRAAFRL